MTEMAKEKEYLRLGLCAVRPEDVESSQRL